MKTLKSIFAALVIVSFASVSVSAQNPNVATGGAAATILEVLEITPGQALDFGTIAPRTEASIVNMTVGGVRTLDIGDAQLVPSAPGQNGTFSISGEANAGFSIAIPTGSINLNSGTSSMTVDNFVSSLGTSSTLDGAGDASLSIGAKLNVAADQASGSYVGTYVVTVAYN